MRTINQHLLVSLGHAIKDGFCLFLVFLVVVVLAVESLCLLVLVISSEIDILIYLPFHNI